MILELADGDILLETSDFAVRKSFYVYVK